MERKSPEVLKPRERHNAMEAQWLVPEFQAAFLRRYASSLEEYGDNLRWRLAELERQRYQAIERRDGAVRYVPWVQSTEGSPEKQAWQLIRNLADRGLRLTPDGDHIEIDKWGELTQTDDDRAAINSSFSDVYRLLSTDEFQRARDRLSECQREVHELDEKIRELKDSPPMQAVIAGTPLTIDLLPAPEVAVEFEVDGWDVVLSAQWGKRNAWESQSMVLHIKLTPTLGDDYPAVLRQMKARTRSSRAFLITREYTGVHAPLAEVKKIFALSDFTLLLSNEIG